ncbi:orotidine-5'-phosphate decarboxylase [Candidatus Micrarchaeota archaeon CG10_big_fil_rev_8_21_14_0_10_59_7]|nr:MAG: orotidine-5'-phosphate decarboxylase [Candidatus Micrarchaeota archaeon CG10_big_fil_rev_8_21_14_0_10_59_7]
MTQSLFRKKFVEMAQSRDSRLILALDTADAQKARDVLEKCGHELAAVKTHPEHALLWGKPHKELVREIKNIAGLPVVLDAKLADVGHSNAMKANYYFGQGYDAIICHAFPGEEAVRAIVDAAGEERGVFVLCAMTSPGHLFSRDIVKKAAEIAKNTGAAGAIAPGNQYDVISLIRKELGTQALILSPGIGAQGGDAAKAAKAGTDFAIVGRSIIGAHNPAEEARRLRKAFNAVI